MEAEAQCSTNECCQETLESWRERVKELIRGFEPADIWNQDVLLQYRSNKFSVWGFRQIS